MIAQVGITGTLRSGATSSSWRQWIIVSLVLAFTSSVLAQERIVPLGELLRTASESLKRDSISLHVDLGDGDTSIGKLNEHLFGRLVERSGLASGLFYNQGFFLPNADPMDVTDEHHPVMVSSRRFYALLSSLNSMQVGRRTFLPSALGLQERAFQVYKMTGSVPIGIIDVTFEFLDGLNGDQVGIDSKGRLVGLQPLELKKKHVFVAAPLIDAVPARRFSVIVLPDLVFSNTKLQRQYRLRVGEVEVPLTIGNAIPVRAKSRALPIAVVSRRDALVAASWIQVVPPTGPLADVRYALLRPAGALSVGNNGASNSKLVVFMAGPKIDPADETWDPLSRDCDGASYAPRLTADEAGGFNNDEWGGIEIGLWLSAKNQPRPREEWEIDPVFFLGGQDLATNEPQALYNEIHERLGLGLEQLQTEFDIFVLTYWTGGGSAPTIGELRARGIRRSVQENAVLLADTLAFLYCDLDITRKAAFLGISMGGIVSRLAFLGIEHGPVGDMFTRIPNFPEQTVPVRLWITIDSPHQGAYIPLGLQEGVQFLDFLPQLEPVIALLNAPSSKELLIEHHSTGSRQATTERQQLLMALDEWGGFPQSIACSFAVSSGGWMLAPPPIWPAGRAYLWKLSDEGTVPTERVPIDPPPESASYEEILDWFGEALAQASNPEYENQWHPDWAAIEEVSNDSSVRSYLPLGPKANPLQDVALRFPLSVGIADINVTIRTLTAESTYAPSAFDEIEDPGNADYVGGQAVGIPPLDWTFLNLDPIKTYRWFLKANVSGTIKVELDYFFDQTIEISIPYDNFKQHDGRFKPMAYEVGGVAPTARVIENALVATFGPPGADGSYTRAITTYLPNHCFVPTISALALNEEFLNAAYHSFQETADDLTRSLFPRAFSRGYYDPEDFLDYWLFTPFLKDASGTTNERIYSNQVDTIQTSDGATWDGQASPFNFFATNGGLAHPRFGSETGEFLIERIFIRNVDSCYAPSTGDLSDIDIARLRESWRKSRGVIPDAIRGPLPPLPMPSGGSGLIHSEKQRIRRALGLE